MKKEFKLKKDVVGAITIRNDYSMESKGFATPNNDGKEFIKHFKKLKDGDSIFIRFEK